jgi:predicted ATPase/DNA-binding winged helix-turn-helix (wHTH) protein
MTPVAPARRARSIRLLVGSRLAYCPRQWLIEGRQVSSVYGFDEFELDAHKFELRREGGTVSTQPKVLRVLLHLVENRERSVSSRELLDTLWPGEAVTLASVKRAIAGARRALGERGESESSIRTVRGHGYRFVREVHVLGERRELPANEARAAVTRVRSDERSVFVAREQPIATIERTLALVQSGSCQGLMVHGEPGIGKTSLLRELDRRASEQGARVLWARCSEAHASPPLWSVLQMLRQGADDLDPTLLSQLNAAATATPVPHLELRHFGAGAPRAAETETAPSKPVLSAIVALLSDASQRKPIVVVLDDVQHADDATLQLIAALPRELQQRPVLVAVALRPLLESEFRTRPALRTHVSESSSTRIDLEPFSDGELASYASQRIEGVVADEALAALRAHCGGNPRLCEAVLQSVLASGAPGAEWWRDLDRSAQNSATHAAIERQLSSLSQPARSLLLTAAVIGRHFTLASLARAERIRVEDALALCSDALALGLIRETSSSILHFQFVHPIVRNGLYAQMSRAERSRRHAQVGFALEAQTANEPARTHQLAEHFLLAAPVDGGGRALKYALEAARAASQQGAYEQAVAYLDRALQWSALGEIPARAHLALLLQKSKVLAGLGDAERTRETVWSAARYARELRDADGMVQAATLLGRFPLRTGVDAENVALIRDALAMLSHDDPQRPRVEALLARAQIWSRNRDERARRATVAFAAAGKLADPAVRGEALLGCLHAFADPEFLPQRLSIAEEVESIGRDSDDRSLLLAAAAARVWAYAELGDMPGVDANISALELLSEHGHEPFARWQAKVFRAMRALVAGRLDAAAEFSKDALDLGTRLGRANAYHVYCTQMGGVLRLQGKLAEAAELVRDISLRHPAIAGWQAALASVEAELGRVQHAREVLGRLLDRDLAALYGDPYGLGALAPAADLCAQVGDAAQAKQIYDALLPYADRHGVVSMGTSTHGPLARHLGRLAARMNDAARAEQHFERAIELAEQSASPTFTSLSCLGYAQMLVAAHETRTTGRAALLTTRAFQVARESGLWNIVERVEVFAQHAAFKRAQVQ